MRKKTERTQIVLTPEQKQKIKTESKLMFGKENINKFVCHLIDSYDVH